MACKASDVSTNDFTDEGLSFLDMELEALQSIFLNELEVKENEKYTTVSIDLNPSTADQLDQQYVRMTLEFILDEEYPEKIPEIKIRNPRGLSDEKLNSITQDLLMIAESKKGSSMLFEMIDAAKEHLTMGNIPSGECAICLHGFNDRDVFTKTECYHYFHSHCLARYAKNFFENPRNGEEDSENKLKSNELLCPMCRIPIEFNDWDSDYPPPDESYDSTFALSEEIVELQKKMAALFQKQVEKGGIIDIEAEKNKYLLEISNIPTQLNTEDKLEENPVAEGGSLTVNDSKNEQSDVNGSPARDASPDRKEYVREPNKRFDHRTRSRNNFYRPNDRNNRYDHRYNKQSFNHGSYNRYRYGKQNLEHSYQDDYERTKDSSVPRENKYRYGKHNSENSYRDESERTKDSSVPRENKYRYGRHNLENSYRDESERTKDVSVPRENRYRYGRHNLENSYRDESVRTTDSSVPRENRYRYGKHNSENSYRDESEKTKDSSVPQEDKYRYGKHNSDNSIWDESERSKDSSVPQEDLTKNEDTTNSSPDMVEDTSETSEDPSPKLRSKYNPNFSPRYNNRGYRHGRNNYNNYDSRRSDKSGYHERGHSQTSRRSDTQRAEESSSRKLYVDLATQDDDNHKSGDRSSSYKRDNDYYPKQKYSDNRNNPHHGYKGAYSGRDAYPNSYNSRGNRYRYSNDREQYQERNYRDKRTYRDVKYKNNGDTAYRSTGSSRNYSGSKPERYSNRSYPKSSNHESESLELNNQNQNGGNETLPAENGSAASSNFDCDSSHKEGSLHKDFEEKSSDVIPAVDSSSSNILPNAFNEISDVTPRTVNPPPGFANPLKKVVYGLQGANPPPGFNKR